MTILTPESQPKLPSRTYDARLENCYDGDTCTFEVSLVPKFNTCDFGLGFDAVGIDPNVALSACITVHPKPDNTAVHLVRHNQHVRLCDINAPELHPGEPAAAVKARDDLVGWIKAAKKVQLVVPQGEHGDEYEKYGRLLVYIMADGVNLNEKQLAAGNAKPFIKCR